MTEMKQKKEGIFKFLVNRFWVLPNILKKDAELFQKAPHLLLKSSASFWQKILCFLGTNLRGD